MHELSAAMRSLERAVTGGPRSTTWSGVVGSRLRSLRGAYIEYLQRSMGSTNAAVEDNPWLSARLLMLRREQARVADEIDRLIEACTPDVDAGSLRQQVDTLLARLTRAREREVGLLYESVDMEIGGEQ